MFVLADSSEFTNKETIPQEEPQQIQFDTSEILSSQDHILFIIFIFLWTCYFLFSYLLIFLKF